MKPINVLVAQFPVIALVIGLTVASILLQNAAIMLGLFAIGELPVIIDQSNNSNRQCDQCELAQDDESKPIGFTADIE